MTFTPEELASAALSDKKRTGKKIALIFPETIGRCIIEEIDVSNLPAAFRRGIETVKELNQ